MGVRERREAELRRFAQNVERIIVETDPGLLPRELQTVEGSDASGAVYCLVNLGGMLTDVVIMNDWWTAVGPGGVAAAVLEALRSAREKAGLARMVLAHFGRPSPALESVRGPVFGKQPPVELPPYDAPEFGAALALKVDRAATRLREVEQFVRDRDAGEEHEVAGPRGLFRVVVRGGVVVGAQVRQFGLRQSDAAELAADARDALLAARPSLTGHGGNE